MVIVFDFFVWCGSGRGMGGAPQAVRSTERSEPLEQPDP